jgi:hypothetical protein
MRAIHFDPFALCRAPRHDHAASLLEVAALLDEAQDPGASIIS